MRVRTIVRELCGRWVKGVHATRLEAVMAVVQGIVAGRRISVLAIGRALAGKTKPKHSIKRVDRLLSNPKLVAERPRFYRAVAHRLIRCRRPVLLVDWTRVSEGFHALVAAIPGGGRALAIYSEVHPESELGAASVQNRFLRNLRDVLGPDCSPTLVLDAGFHGPFLEEIRKLGWTFVGRLRTNAKMRSLAGGPWLGMRSLLERATRIAHDLGVFRLYRTTRSYDARLVLGAKQPLRRARRVRSRSSSSRRGGVHARTIRGWKEPWLLVTSLEAPAAAVIDLYRQRMQIEQIFRDVKNPRFGWCMRHLRGHSAERLATLLMLVVLALTATIAIGLAAETAGLARQYQANTVRRRTLSLFVLALAIIERGDEVQLRDRPLAALASLQTRSHLGHPTA